jgi:ribokinase
MMNRSTVTAVAADVVVIGSINHDLTVVTSRLPRPGETVLGTHHYSGGGGKGANQAVAAARMGARVAMVGRIGDDEHGRALHAALSHEGIDVTHVGVDRDTSTGLAVITIDEDAENTIVVSPGANDRLRPDHLDRELLANATIVLAQLEIPLETVTAAARLTQKRFILNPAPARPLPSGLLDHVDVLVPNRSELGVLGGVSEPATAEEAVAAAGNLRPNACTVVTLGAAGALIVEGGRSHLVPAHPVDPVDPTGAGDAFCGALAHSLSQGQDLDAAVATAVVAGALATTRPGAQTAMPTAGEVEQARGR